MRRRTSESQYANVQCNSNPRHGLYLTRPTCSRDPTLAHIRARIELTSRRKLGCLRAIAPRLAASAQAHALLCRQHLGGPAPKYDTTRLPTRRWTPSVGSSSRTSNTRQKTKLQAFGHEHSRQVLHLAATASKQASTTYTA